MVVDLGCITVHVHAWYPLTCVFLTCVHRPEFDSEISDLDMSDPEFEPEDGDGGDDHNFGGWGGWNSYARSSASSGPQVRICPPNAGTTLFRFCAVQRAG